MYNPSIMVRRLLFAVLTAFLLQISWGMVASYCTHETGKAANHFGHHQHQHKVTPQDSAESGTSLAKKGAPHTDCASCAHISFAIIGVSPAAAQLTVSGFAPPERDTSLDSLAQTPPERPQWHAAA
ncbi:hypothetical protein ACHMW6_25200 [Pseudoduganella sp. UC29_106]|uniref:hypothetical protein n=1 Tax=Pseudoduganella sp. UC29_106 TaxID=3374553 RepID=UPI003756DACE